MKNEHKSVNEMWENYLNSIGEDTENTDKKYFSWHFCDNEKDAYELAELVKKGIKRATASLHKLYEVDGEKLPEVSDLNIITDWKGIAQCIIKTKKVTVLPFNAVTEEFANTEGEGDKSLKYWRKVHIEAFSRTLIEYKMEFSEELLVVCEEFDLIYK